MVLCFGVVRPYKGVDVLVEAFRSIAGAELWVVGRPLGVSLDALGAPAERALRAALRERRRAARLLPPRRPAGAAPPQRRRVGRAVRRPRVRQADGALRRGRLPRGGGGARRRRGWCRPGDPAALGAAIGELLADPAERERLAERAARRRRRALLVGLDRARGRWRSTRRCSRDEGRLHGQEQALGRAGARLARGARARRWRPWWPPSPDALDARRSSGSTWRRGATGCRSPSDDDALRRARRADVDLVVSFLFWNRIREPLISLGRIGCLNFHPAPLPDFRGVGGYNVAILEGLREWGVSCHFVDEQLRHRRPGGGGALPDRPATRRPPSRSTWRARSTCSRLFERVMERALRRRGAAAHAPGRGPLRVARGVRGAARGAPGRRPASASCAPSGTRPARARCWRWTGAG